MDRRTEFSSLDRVCIPCNAVIIHLCSVYCSPVASFPHCMVSHTSYQLSCDVDVVFTSISASVSLSADVLSIHSKTLKLLIRNWCNFVGICYTVNAGNYSVLVKLDLWPWELFQYFDPTPPVWEILTCRATNALRVSPYLSYTGVSGRSSMHTAHPVRAEIDSRIQACECRLAFPCDRV